MRKNLWLAAIVICLAGALPAQVAAQGRGGRGEQQGGRGAAAGAAGEAAAELPVPKEESVATDHTIHINGETIAYTATASTTLLKNAAGEPIGLMYSVAYTRSDVKDLSTRPISFFYNGGPGSASMWLHMGAFGPRRVVHSRRRLHRARAVQARGQQREPPRQDRHGVHRRDGHRLQSRRRQGKASRISTASTKTWIAFGQFINTYINRNDRWNSPKFLIGESYGTFRSAALGNYLQNRYSMHLNGIVLISSVLDLSSITFGQRRRPRV